MEYKKNMEIKKINTVHLVTEIGDMDCNEWFEILDDNHISYHEVVYRSDCYPVYIMPKDVTLSQREVSYVFKTLDECIGKLKKYNIFIEKINKKKYSEPEFKKYVLIKFNDGKEKVYKSNEQIEQLFKNINLK